CAQNHGGMRAVQDTYFTLFVRLVIVCNEDRKACLLKRELIFDGLRSLDYPESEDFSGIHDVVFVAVCLVQSSSFASWITGYNAVYQCGTEDILVLDPADEVFLKVPLLCVIQHAFLKLFSIVIDKLTCKDDKAFSLFLTKCLIT